MSYFSLWDNTNKRWLDIGINSDSEKELLTHIKLFYSSKNDILLEIVEHEIKIQLEGWCS